MVFDVDLYGAVSMLKGKWLGIGISVLLLPQSAVGALIVIDKPIQPQQPVSAVSGSIASLPPTSMTKIKYASLIESMFPRIMFNGPAPDIFIPSLSGQGRGVSINDAVRQIVPHSFSIKIGDELKAGGAYGNKRTEWMASAHWIATLHNLLNKEDLIATVDWMISEVQVNKAAPIIQPGLRPASKAPQPGYQRLAVNQSGGPVPSSPPSTTVAGKASVDLGPVSSVGASAAPAVVSTTPPAPILLPVWRAEVGKTLRQVLTGWAEKEEWNLVWSATKIDYPIQAEFSFDGDFLKAVQSTVLLYAKAERPLYGRAYPSQKLVIISDKRI